MYDRWMLPLSVPSLSLIHWFPFIFSYHHFNLSSLSFSFLSFFLCSKLVLLFLLQDHRLCYLRSHQGVKLVDGKLINSGIPDCSTHLWCVCVYVCARILLSSRASVTRRKKPPTWKPTWGGSTDFATWLRQRSAWWVENTTQFQPYWSLQNIRKTRKHTGNRTRL